MELGESTKSAILREMIEELQTEVTIDKELAFAENFYLDKNALATHELSFYYIVKPKNFDNIQFNNYSSTENDKGKTKVHNFEWLDINSLSDVDLKPEFIKSKLASRKL